MDSALSGSAHAPPKILFLGANGRDTTRLRLGAEVRDIRRELETAGAADSFHITAELAVRPVDLQRLLLLHEPNLIHFSGHGLNPDPNKTTTTNGGPTTREFAPSETSSVDGFTGGLLLENDTGAAVAVRPDVFADLLAIVKRDDLEVMAKEAADADRKAVKLDKLLGHVSMRMAPEEREVMARLSIFPRGIGADLLYALVESGGDIAGVLAGSTEKRLVLILRRLVTQGLAFSYGEANHCVYTAHPFLRDHFKKLVGVKTEDVHEVLRQKLAPSLQLRPKELPRDKETLDRLEALIEHTRLAGKPVEAFELYWYGMGHSNHLSSTLGEYRRGKRIVESFSEDASPARCALNMPARFRAALVTSWGHYADYLGDLPLAKSCIEVAIHIQQRASQEKTVWAGFQHLAGLEFAMGHSFAMAERAREGLAQAVKAKDEAGMMMCHTYLGTAAFLSGEIADARRHFVKATFVECRPLYAGRGVLEADFRRMIGERAMSLEQSQQNLAICEYRRWNDLVAVVHTILGHLVLQDDRSESRTHLAQSRTWARTGDLEVTLRAHRLASEIELHEKRPDLAHAEASEGLLLAETHGYGLYAIDLLLLLARACLALNRPSESFRHAKLALDRSTNPECGYAWGEADALHWLGLSLRDLGERVQARERFEQAAAIRARIEHPDAEDSRALAMALAED